MKISEWQITAIRKGIRQADGGQFISHANLKAKWEQKLAATDADIAAAAKQRAKRAGNAKKWLE